MRSTARAGARMGPSRTPMPGTICWLAGHMGSRRVNALPRRSGCPGGLRDRIALLLGLLALAPACSSAGSGGSSSPGIFCSDVPNVAYRCGGWHKLSASDQQSFKDNCIQEGGKIVSVCPSDNLLGCCTVNSGLIEKCAYASSSSDAGTNADWAKQDCDMSGGTWSTTP